MIELPELYEIEEQWPVLASMALIEVLLSVDNLLVVQRVAEHLPETQRKLALKIGAFGSYFLRAAALLVTAPIISSYFVAKIIGSLYMIHLMASHFTADHSDDDPAELKSWGFGKTVLGVLAVDFILNTDNIVAAVSLSKTLWVVCSSVFFGIVFVQILGGVTVRAIKRLPVLRDSVYVLVGWIGLLLLSETLFKSLKISHLTDLQKFQALIFITLLTLIYDALPENRRFQSFFTKLVLPLLKVVNAPLSILFWPIRKLTSLAS
jgi:predicted tellurium resistance membrane protein TerC